MRIGAAHGVDLGHIVRIERELELQLVGRQDVERAAVAMVGERTDGGLFAPLLRRRNFAVTFSAMWPNRAC